jgi:sugar/nucleoside kinase (ribokinase family)
MSKYDIIVIGTSVFDIPVNVYNLSEREETTFTKISHNFGGCGLNSAVQAARLGLKTKLITKIGDDVFGNLLKDVLDKEKIKYLAPEEGKTGICICLINNAKRSFLYDPGISKQLTAEDISLEELNKSACVLFNGLFHTPGLKDQKIKNVLSKYNGLKVFDFGWGDDDKWLDSVNQLLPFIDILLINSEEILRLTEKDNINEAILFLKKQGVKNIILKQGDKGATFYGKEQVHQPVFNVDKIVDTTGAGDSFNSSFLSAFLQHKSISECLKFATAAANLTIQKRGTNFPTLVEVKEFLENEN